MTSPRHGVVLGTGGTIAGRAANAADHVGYTTGQVAVDDLLGGIRAQLPEGSHWEVEQVAQVDSKDMGPEVWQPLLRRLQHHLARPEVDAVVVTHGTDTLEETAWLLQAVLAPAKPVVLACAMRPASALVPDGPQNLLDACTVALAPGARGVVAVCAGQVHAANHVQKRHTYRLDAFDSGDAGPLGVVEAGQLTLWQPWPHGDGPRTGLLERLLATAQWPRVEWVSSHAGADGALVHALLAHSQTEGVPALRGLLVAGTGNGTLHRSLEAALQTAADAGVQVWRVSRCAQGRVLAASDARWPVAPAGLSAAKARLALQLHLVEVDLAG